MPSKPDEDRHSDHNVLQSTVYSQPWWHGVGTGGSVSETALKTAREQPNGNGSASNEANQSLGICNFRGHSIFLMSALLCLKCMVFVFFHRWESCSRTRNAKAYSICSYYW